MWPTKWSSIPTGWNDYVKKWATDVRVCPLNDDSIRAAVNFWLADVGGARNEYGHISSWDVSRVTRMDKLFCGDMSLGTGCQPGAIDFNADLSNWNVTLVRNLTHIFETVLSLSPCNKQKIHMRWPTQWSSAPMGWSDYSSWADLILTDDTIKRAVDTWLEESQHGTSNCSIATWDVSRVTRFDGLFCGDLSQPMCQVAAFTKNDKGTTVQITGDLLKVDGQVRFVEWNDLAHSNCRGYIQEVDPQVKGLIKICKTEQCDDECTFQNPMRTGAKAFTGGIEGWNVSSGTNFSNLFRGAAAFNTDLSTWDVRSAVTMESMFNGAVAFDGDISSWDTSNVKTFSHCFNGAISFTASRSSGLARWTLSSALDLTSLFKDASLFNSDLSKWRVGSVRDMNGLFDKARSFTSDISTWDLTSVQNLQDFEVQVHSFFYFL